MTEPATPTEWMPRERWEARRGEDCPLCEGYRSAEVMNDDGHLIAVMRLSHLRLLTCQYPAGSCSLVCAKHCVSRTTWSYTSGRPSSPI